MSDGSERDYTEETKSSSKDFGSKPVAKSRASRAGTRSTKTLDAEQLKRKRAVDRVAQRAIRQRTRDHIERLENRIEVLLKKNSNSDPAFEAARRQNAELEEELSQLRKAFIGMVEATCAPGASQPHAAYLSNTKVKVTPGSYPPPSGGQNVDLGYPMYAPTANPMSKPDHSWQPPPHSAHYGQRDPNLHQHSGIVQNNSWSRIDHDSDYDSNYGLDEMSTGMRHLVVPHPDEMQNLYSPQQIDTQPLYRRNQVWQHPNGLISNGPYDGIPPTGTRNDAIIDSWYEGLL